MACCAFSRRGLKICCGVFTIFMLILVTVIVTLFFTVFKPKQPRVTPHPTTLEDIEFQIFPTLTLNITLGLVLTIENRNYGSFMFKNSSATISYRGATIGEIPVQSDTVPARSKLNISTYANITADKLISDPSFWHDLGSGCFNLTSLAAFHGKVTVFNIFKLGASVFSTCDISLFVQTHSIQSTCSSKIKL